MAILKRYPLKELSKVLDSQYYQAKNRMKSKELVLKVLEIFMRISFGEGDDLLAVSNIDILGEAGKGLFDLSYDDGNDDDGDVEVELGDDDDDDYGDDDDDDNGVGVVNAPDIGSSLYKYVSGKDYRK